MTVHVIGNAVLDETFAVETWPAAGISQFVRAGLTDLGGKGANQAIILARAGVDTRLVAVVGDDAAGGMIRERLAAEPMDCRLIIRHGMASDRSIILVTPDGENAVLTTTACSEALGVADIETALASAAATDVLVLQGNLRLDAARAALALARARRLRSAFNPSPLRAGFMELVGLADIVVVNAGEAEALTGHSGAHAAAALNARGVATAIVTLGAEGSLLARGGEVISIPAHPAEAVDTSGAGDAFMGAALASALLRDTAIDPLALAHGARIAAHCVARPGTVAAFPGAADIARLLDITRSSSAS